jgi:signal transduction histidine kinase
MEAGPDTGIWGDKMRTRPAGLVGVQQTATVGIRRPVLDGSGLAATGVAAAMAAAALTAELVWRPDAHAAGLRSTIETTITLAALTAAVLLRSRIKHTGRFSDLLLVVALATVAVTDFVFEALPALADDRTGTFGIGARLACGMLVTSTLLVAAYVPDRWLIAPGRWTLSRAILAGISVVAIGELIDLVAGPGGRNGSAEAYEPLMTVFALVSFVALMTAGFGFVSRADADNRDRWLLAAACYLLAVASLERLAQPMPLASWVTVAEPFRIVAFGLLFVTALRRYGGNRAAQEAVRAERIRIADDLHDGLAQDLAFIVAYADRLEHRFGEAHLLVTAARRALAASRGTIVDLEASKAPTTAAALRDVATELQERFGVEITVRVPTADTQEPTLADRHEMVRIAREAIGNAIRHGGARRIEVTLGSRDKELLLRISDDGCGAGAPGSHANSGTGLGMRAMRSRARSLGGRLIAHHRAGGTEIDVVKSAPASKETV